MATGRRWHRKVAAWPVVSTGRALTLALTVTLAMLLLGLHHLLVAWLVGISAAAVAAYAYDKWAARGAHLRIPERVLLVLALLGGTPGALLSILLFRHKLRKGPFLARLGLILLAQLALVAAWRYAGGQP